VSLSLNIERASIIGWRIQRYARITRLFYEIESINKGVLFPRVSLTQLNNPSPLTSHVMGMVVFNKTKISNTEIQQYKNMFFSIYFFNIVIAET
jgi:hypothetical protein